MASTPKSPHGSDPTTPSSASAPRTRTLAIIKNHALEHRLSIEPRIIEAGFEIVKERQLEFDVETDPDFMYELFGEDVQSFSEGPVWVYVLERRRAVEVLHALMGDRDPAVARETTPNSLRALYGISLIQNAMLGSPDAQTADFQISTIFASSPVLSTSDLPDERKFDSVRSLSSDLMDSLRLSGSRDGDEYAQSSGTAPSTAGRSSHDQNGQSTTSANGKLLFRARALPKTHVAPDIAPRTTKAAALRAGQVSVAVDKVTPTTARAPLTQDQLARTFANVPGHKRADAIPVASTAAPTIAPRMTKAAQLRIAKDAEGKRKVPPMGVVRSPEKEKPSAETNVFSGVPGHKRMDSIPVASVAAPTVKPRMNRSAELRKSGVPPPTSFRAPIRSKTTPGTSTTPESPTTSRPSSRPSSVQGDYPEEQTPRRKRPVSLQPPAIAPRPNRSAALRAQGTEKPLAFR